MILDRESEYPSTIVSVKLSKESPKNSRVFLIFLHPTPISLSGLMVDYLLRLPLCLPVHLKSQTLTSFQNFTSLDGLIKDSRMIRERVANGISMGKGV